MLKQTDEVLTEGLKAANQATKTQAKDLAATKAELKAELQEISMRCSVLESELRTVSMTKAGPEMTMVKEMVVREVTFQCTEHRRTQSRGPGLGDGTGNGGPSEPLQPCEPWCFHTRSH